MKILAKVGHLTSLPDAVFTTELNHLTRNQPDLARCMLRHWATASASPKVATQLGEFVGNVTATETKTVKASTPSINIQLPSVILSQAFTYLDLKSMMSTVFCVSRHWQQLAGAPTSWNTLDCKLRDVPWLKRLLPRNAFGMPNLICKGPHNEYERDTKQTGDDPEDIEEYTRCLHDILTWIGTRLRRLTLSYIVSEHDTMDLPAVCWPGLEELHVYAGSLGLEKSCDLVDNKLRVFYGDTAYALAWVPTAALQELTYTGVYTNVLSLMDITPCIASLVHLNIVIDHPDNVARLERERRNEDAEYGDTDDHAADGEGDDDKDDEKHGTTLPSLPHAFKKLERVRLVIKAPIDRNVITPFLRMLNPHALQILHIVLNVNEDHRVDATTFLNRELHASLTQMISLRSLYIETSENTSICVPPLPNLQRLWSNSNVIILENQVDIGDKKSGINSGFPQLQRIESHLYNHHQCICTDDTLPMLSEIVCGVELNQLFKKQDTELEERHYYERVTTIMSQLTVLRCQVNSLEDMNRLNKARNLHTLYISDGTRRKSSFSSRDELLLDYIKGQKNLRRVQLDCKPYEFFDDDTLSVHDIVQLKHLQELHFYNILESHGRIDSKHLGYTEGIAQTITIYEGRTDICQTHNQETVFKRPEHLY